MIHLTSSSATVKPFSKENTMWKSRLGECCRAVVFLDWTRTNSSCRAIGLLLRVPLRQHYSYHFSAYYDTVLESRAASDRYRSNDKSSQDTLTITPLNACSHCIPVAAAIRSEKSNLPGTCLNFPSSSLPTFFGEV